MNIDLKRLFVAVLDKDVQSFLSTYYSPAEGVTRSTAYDNKISFLGSTGFIFTKGQLFGGNPSDMAKFKAILAGLGGTDEPATVIAAIDAAKSAVLGTATTSSSETQTVGAVSDRVKALETALKIADEDNANAIDKIDEVFTWFAGIKEDDPVGSAIITAVASLGAKTDKITDDENTKDTAWAHINKLESDLENIDIPEISVADSSTNYVEITGDDKHTISIKTSSLGDVGLEKTSTGWQAGSTNSATGLATAADVAAELVADEEVIAAALNEHESRLLDVEDAVQNLDNSVTTIATSTVDTEKSDYVTITDAADPLSNDHTYTLKVQEASHSAGTLTDGLVNSTVLNDVLGDLWESYSAPQA